MEATGGVLKASVEEVEAMAMGGVMEATVEEVEATGGVTGLLLRRWSPQEE